MKLFLCLRHRYEITKIPDCLFQHFARAVHPCTQATQGTAKNARAIAPPPPNSIPMMMLQDSRVVVLRVHLRLQNFCSLLHEHEPTETEKNVSIKNGVAFGAMRCDAKPIIRRVSNFTFPVRCRTHIFKSHWFALVAKRFRRYVFVCVCATCCVIRISTITLFMKQSNFKVYIFQISPCMMWIHFGCESAEDAVQHANTIRFRRKHPPQ